MEEGRLEAIWIKRMKGGPMERREKATLGAGSGLAGNANQGGRRQVVLMDTDRWTRLEQQIGRSLDPSVRRGNLLVSGVTLAGSRGRVLKVGQCRIRIFGEARPCAQMDEAFPGLGRAMEKDWGGGAVGEVLDDGDIAVGETVGWLDEDASEDGASNIPGV